MSKNNEIPMGKQKSLSYSSVESQVKFLQGKVLTVIDASYTNDRQLKAVKDLVNRMFSEQLSYMLNICYPDVGGIMSNNQAREILGDEYDQIVNSAEILD